jgi:general secretion pathway protein G
MNIFDNIRNARLSELAANQRGMTLVEIMIVVTIMASVMGVVGFSVMKALERANINEAEIQISQLSHAVDAYYLQADPHEHPSSLEELAEQRIIEDREVPKDPWGNEYVYRNQKRGFEILSLGPDGQEGTNDDISSIGVSG